MLGLTELLADHPIIQPQNGDLKIFDSTWSNNAQITEVQISHSKRRCVRRTSLLCRR